MSKPNDIYIAVQNFLVNEMGVTKDSIRKLVEERVDRVVKKHINSMMQGDKISNLVNSKIESLSTKGIRVSGYQHQPIENYIRVCLHEGVKELILAQYDIGVSLEKKAQEPK